MLIEGREFCIIVGSDPARDGMFAELYAGSSPDGRPLAECFYADSDQSFTFTVYDRGTPEEALSWLRREGAVRLPPERRTVKRTLKLPKSPLNCAGSADTLIWFLRSLAGA